MQCSLQSSHSLESFQQTQVVTARRTEAVSQEACFGSRVSDAPESQKVTEAVIMQTVQRQRLLGVVGGSLKDCVVKFCVA